MAYARVAVREKNVREEEEKQTSSYQPPQSVRDVLARVRRDFSDAENLRNRAYEEFNDVSMIQRLNIDQRRFNSYVPPRSTDPDEAWKANTVRPITRNKCISIAAHVTSVLQFPKAFAQNKDDDEDKDSALVMEDLMEWALEQARYEKTYLYAVIGALYNPASFIYAGYHESYRTIKEIQPNGKWKEKEVLDEENSGFLTDVVPPDEMYIGNMYEGNIQKQPFLIWRRILDYNDAKIKYAGNEMFEKYVSPGLRVFYVDEENTFYEQYDDELEYRLVEEITYYNRAEDLELTIVNGVLLCDEDQPIRRIDKKYPFVKFGYELKDEGRFFYYTSLVDKLRDDQRVLDTLYNMVLDGSFINLFPPAIVLGDEEIDTSVITPGTVTTFRETTKFDTIQTNNNLAAGMNAINMVERSINESSADPSLQGIATSGTQTAYEVSRLEANARQMLGLFGKMIAFMVKELGELVISDILQYMTVGEASELTGDTAKLKFRSLLMKDRMSDGRKKMRKIDFDLTVPEEEIPEEDALRREIGMLEDEGGLDGDKEIIKVNPKLFRDLKYQIYIVPDVLTKPSSSLEKVIKLEAYDRAIQNPLANQEAIFRDFLLENYVPGETDKYIRVPQQQMQPPGMGAGIGGGMGEKEKVVEKMTETIKEPTKIEESNQIMAEV